MILNEELVKIPYLKNRAVHKIYKNGFQFIYVPKKGEVFNISSWVKTGSIHENGDNNGVSHFLEHLMFKGTERFGPGEFDKAMESMGAVINAATWKDFTFYYITGPNLNGNFDKALDMHADMLLFSTLPEAEIGEPFDPYDPSSKTNKRERGVVAEEIGMRQDQPWTKIYNSLNHMMYPDGHPYQRDVIGTRDIISQISKEEIVSYYRKWYSPRNLTTIVVGDFEERWLEERLLKCFDFSKQQNNQQHQEAPDYPDKNRADGQRFRKIEGDFQTSFFMIGFHAPNPANLKETIASDIASKVLGEGRSSRLYQAFIERPREPVFNSISSGQSTFKLGNVFYVQGNFSGPDSEGNLQAVLDEIKAYVSEKRITSEEFQRAVKKMKVDFAETSETASGIAESIGESITITGSLDTYVCYLDVLRTITLDDIQRIAAEWFHPDKCYKTLLVPKGEA